MRLGNKKAINEKNCEIKKIFFFILQNNCFQSQESHQLSTDIRILAPLFFYDNPMKPLIKQKISYDKNNKVKTTVTDKIKKFNYFFKKEVWHPLENNLYLS